MGAFYQSSVIQSKSGIFLLLACGIILAGCKKEVEAPRQAPVVVTGSPMVQDVPVWQEWIGSLTGEVNASILPQVIGYVQSQDYQNGAIVKKGEVLFRIDSSIYKDQLEQARGRLNAAKAQWKEADYNRNLYKPLAIENVVSKQKYEDSVLAAQSSLADIQAAEAAVSQAERNVSYTLVLSPVDGVAGVASVQIGDLVSPSGKVMAEVSSVNPIRVDFAVTEREWLSGMNSKDEKILQPGSELTIVLQNGETYPAKAHISSVDRAFSSDTGTIGVQASVSNENYLLRPGMTIRVRALREVKKNALTVPQTAIYSTQGRFFIVLVEDGNKPRVVPVTAGPIIGTSQVVEPLEEKLVNEGSSIVVDGVMDAMMAASRGLPVVQAAKNPGNEPGK